MEDSCPLRARLCVYDERGRERKRGRERESKWIHYHSCVCVVNLSVVVKIWPKKYMVKIRKKSDIEREKRVSVRKLRNWNSVKLIQTSAIENTCKTPVKPINCMTWVDFFCVNCVHTFSLCPHFDSISYVILNTSTQIYTYYSYANYIKLFICDQVISVLNMCVFHVINVWY